MHNGARKLLYYCNDNACKYVLGPKETSTHTQALELFLVLCPPHLHHLHILTHEAVQRQWTREEIMISPASSTI